MTTPMPEYGGQQVSPEGIPGVQLTQDLPLETFGGGATAQAGAQAGAGVASSVAYMMGVEQRKADQTWADEARMKASQLHDDVLYPLMQQKGMNALGIHDQFNDGFNKGFSDIEGEANSPRRKLMAENIKKSFIDQGSRLASRYTAQQIDEYQINTQKASMATFSSSAAKSAAINPGVTENHAMLGLQALDKLEELRGIQTIPDENGKGNEIYLKDKQEYLGNLWKGAINSMLDNGQDSLAQRYYEKHKADLSEVAQTDIEDMISDGKLNGEIGTTLNNIRAKLSGTPNDNLTGFRADAGKLPSGDVRDGVFKAGEAIYEQEKKSHEADVSLMLERRMQAPLQDGQTRRSLFRTADWNMLTKSQQTDVMKADGSNATPAQSRAAMKIFLSSPVDDRAGMTYQDFQKNYWNKMDTQTRSTAYNLWREAKEGKGTPKNDTAATVSDAVSQTGLSDEAQQKVFQDASKTVSDQSKGDTPTKPEDIKKATVDAAVKHVQSQSQSQGDPKIIDLCRKALSSYQASDEDKRKATAYLKKYGQEE